MDHLQATQWRARHYEATLLSGHALPHFHPLNKNKLACVVRGTRKQYILKLFHDAVHHFEWWGEVGCGKEMDIVFFLKVHMWEASQRKQNRKVLVPLFCYKRTPISFLLLRFRYLSVMWYLPTMWSHVITSVTHCPSDSIVLVTSIVPLCFTFISFTYL